MITVFDAVICGVTFSVSAASRNDTVTVVGDGLNRNLHALGDFGLDVVLRRDPRRRQDPALAAAFERRQRHIQVERAVHRAQGDAVEGAAG